MQRKKVLIILTVFTLLLTSCAFNTNEYTTENSEQKTRFYSRGQSLIKKGKRLDLKYELMNTYQPLESAFGIYFKNEKYEKVKQIKIILEVQDESGTIQNKIIKTKKLNFRYICGYSKNERLNRYLVFNLERILHEDYSLFKKLSKTQINANKMTFIFYFEKDKETFEFDITNQEMIEYKVLKLSKTPLELFDQHTKKDTYDSDPEYYQVFDNCYVAYFYDKTLWRRLVNECYDDLLSSKKKKELLSDVDTNAVSIFFPFKDNQYRTREDSIFVYNSLKRLYKGKSYIPAATKKEIVEYFEKINESLHFVDEKKMNRLLNLDWSNKINDFDKEIFQWEINE